MSSISRSSSGMVIVREERSGTPKAVVTLHDLLRAREAPAD
jgi:hypothetical protein